MNLLNKSLILLMIILGISACSSISQKQEFDLDNKQVDLKNQLSKGDKITIYYKTGEIQTLSILQLKEDRIIGKIRTKTEGKAQEYVVTKVQAEFSNIDKITKHSQDRGVYMVILGALAVII